jgi:hypothetical protein
MCSGGGGVCSGSGGGGVCNGSGGGGGICGHEMQRNIRNIVFVQGIPEQLNDETFIDSRYPSLIVIDDLMRDVTNSKDVCELFVEGSHHRNISVACIMTSTLQRTLFLPGTPSNMSVFNRSSSGVFCFRSINRQPYGLFVASVYYHQHGETETIYTKSSVYRLEYYLKNGCPMQ